MVFSKSFGYALRGILYVAAMNAQKPKVSLDEIAENLAVPRHFLGKVLKRLAKSGIISSSRGPSGGFSLNDTTLSTPLTQIVEISGDQKKLNACVLSLSVCSSTNPCPLHKQADLLKREWNMVLSGTTIADLLINQGKILNRI